MQNRRNISAGIRTAAVTAVVCLSAFCVRGFAQQSESFYFMDIAARRSSLNAGFIAPYEFNAGIPVLGGIHAQLDNNFLSWSRVVWHDGHDSTHIDPARLLGHVSRKARIMFSTDIEVLHFGWRKGQNNFEVGLSAHADFQAVIDKKTLTALVQGPGLHLNENHLDKNTVDINSYAALYFGYSRQLNRNLSIGGRFKILNGLWNLKMSNCDIAYRVDNSDMADNQTVPYQYGLAFSGNIKSNLPLGNQIGSETSLGSLGYGALNFGAALDFGAVYKFGNWEAAAAVNNLGFIFWGDNNRSVYSSKRKDWFYFDGLDEKNINKLSFEDYIKNTFLDAVDSLRIMRKQKGYVTAVPASFVISASYTLAEMHRFGCLFKGFVYDRYFAPEVNVSYTLMPCKDFAVCVNNTFCSGNMFNFGIGIVGNAGPVQFHLSVDRINSFVVSKMRTVNFNFGINLVFGKSSYDFYTGK